MANHREMLLRHLITRGSITHLEAEAEYGCARLASRIHELRKDGYAIKTETVTGKNRNGEKIHYAKYFMEERNQAEPPDQEEV